MLTDYKNIFIFLPIFIAFYILVDNCRLNPKTVSLLIFVLLTLPVLIILGTIFYYHFKNKLSYDTKDECMKYNYNQYGQGLCNVWNEEDKKCYKGIYNNDTNKCEQNLLKNIPLSVYIGSVFIILANLFFHNMKSKCY
jgi:hypothetical protein